MTNKEFFNKTAKTILNECKTENDYIEVYKRVHKYINTHIVDKVDMKYYFESGASERLAMATQRYRKKEEII